MKAHTLIPVAEQNVSILFEGSQPFVADGLVSVSARCNVAFVAQMRGCTSSQVTSPTNCLQSSPRHRNYINTSAVRGFRCADIDNITIFTSFHQTAMITITQFLLDSKYLPGCTVHSRHSVDKRWWILNMTNITTGWKYKVDTQHTCFS